MSSAVNDELVTLYQQMSEHTRDECAKSCRLPHSCCSAMYCEDTIRFAREHRGVELVRTSHPTLPLMGPTGCTVAPYLRPICTVHVCAINSLGFKPGDPEWTARYFDLREAIDALESEGLDDMVEHFSD